MEAKIFNVGHGFCCLIIADNGNVMLFDCGSDDETGFYPSEYLEEQGIDEVAIFVVTNYDEDHISDLPALNNTLRIDTIHRNKSLSPDDLRAMKEESGPLSSAMQCLLDMMRSYTVKPAHLPDFGDIEKKVTYNRYPIDFTDTNNLSVVTFLHLEDFHMVIPGDLEKQGWRKLLEDADFRNELRRTNIFVASHHGRESGYCEDVFDYCKPEVVTISDERKHYATQETIELYEKLLELYENHQHAPSACFMIGFTYMEELRDSLSARKAFERTINRYPESEIAESARWLIEELDDAENGHVQQGTAD